MIQKNSCLMSALKGAKRETIQSSEKYSTKGIKTYKNLEKNGFDFSNSLSKQDYSRIDQMLKKDKGDLVDYEKNRRFKGSSFEEVARIELEIGRKYCGGSYTIRADYGSDSITDGEIGVGTKREIREKLNFHFEHEQDRIGNDTASETSGKFSLKEPVEETDSLVFGKDTIDPKNIKNVLSKV